MKNVGLVLIFIVSFFIINNLVRSIYSLWQKQELVVATQDSLTEEKRKQKVLSEQYAQVRREQYVEEEARNKLFLVKPGEQVVIVPPANDQLSTQSGEMVSKTSVPSWKAWWELFFKQPAG